MLQLPSGFCGQASWPSVLILLRTVYVFKAPVGDLLAGVYSPGQVQWPIASAFSAYFLTFGRSIGLDSSLLSPLGFRAFAWRCYLRKWRRLASVLGTHSWCQFGCLRRSSRGVLGEVSFLFGEETRRDGSATERQRISVQRKWKKAKSRASCLFMPSTS